MVIERLQSLFIAMRQAGGMYILFVDHIHWLFGGRGGRYSIDAHNLLKPVLARRQVQLIGACSIEEYRLYIERDAAMQRRFQEIVLPGM
jgi:ATP-dependent Clp protease ATP-binding subunit ClpA